MNNEKTPYYIDYDDYSFQNKEKIIFDTSVMEQYMSMSLSKSFEDQHNQLELPPLTFCYLLKPGEDVIKVDGLEINQMGDPGLKFQEYILQHIEPSKSYEIAICQSIGRRGKMEDTVVVDCSSIEGTDIIGVFDGHNGKDAAYLCTEQYIKTFKENEGTFEAKLIKTHKQLHDKSCETSKSGTTSTVAFIDKDTIRIAYCGDSPAYIYKNNKIKKITKEHKATNSAEVERIEMNGGVVFGMFGVKRVNGQIMVTRSIGDPSLHPPLTTEPDFIKLEKKGIELLFLMSDGITDGVTEKELEDIISKSGGMFNIAFDTLKLAYVNESSDNLTFIVIKIN
ncbi:protein phosphatase domain containing protein [Entamoeba histolytica HM-1:IMSS-B]|uniref:Protein phosphatase domain-containing protein n=6 Tax=Entamoeba histolytica TaxID=5759 RepID=C4M7Y0_ENTH1|nr:protein phosphatase domain-containing protein [Entamoeba histolytica HM-1:IMSS]EMD49536.1 protein phosphatase domain containing protein [Entamoeba histolytica KU27]EMH76031.1 protein phosphatase domain containing protein [Entamoeba histolytica HM-1:IMSS-B]EMS11883.1 protein phosphatase domain containing protein [Entamoeba histolytica HM-3:IMSS]ENY64816.1 protein phosphatase domain containing protein [Entamoeba histolytica HM-1:IMSS-A]GAT97663.1 protein phosphatase domain-containing protein |eukprot:XP_651473.1 protein phosphatase domain-containing protein [Entamoeba histolytica HM-1:IMSS]